MTLRDIEYRCIVSCFRGFHPVAEMIKIVFRHLRYPGSKQEPNNLTHNRLVLAAARKLGLKVDQLPDQFLRISDGQKVIYSNDFDFSFESLTAYWMCGNKHLTSLLLREAGVPVPEFAAFQSYDLQSAVSAFHKLKPPLVVKPCFGSGGDGITVGVETMRQFRRACYRAALRSNQIIVEQFVTGRHWRITLFEGELLFACERLPAFVVGDGKSSIRTLVGRHNSSIASKDGFVRAYPIHIDEDTLAVLREKNLAPSSVPLAGTKVVLKRICNAAVGGLTVDVSRRLHNDYLKLAQKAASTMGARLVGVDIIAPDVELPLENSCVVNEVNTTPDLLLSHFDISGSGDAIECVAGLLSKIFASRLVWSDIKLWNAHHGKFP